MTDTLEELRAETVINLTDWERSKVSQFAASNALTYLGHHAAGGLRPHEVDEMERWNALREKLRSAINSKEPTS